MMHSRYIYIIGIVKRTTMRHLWQNMLQNMSFEKIIADNASLLSNWY